MKTIAAFIILCICSFATQAQVDNSDIPYEQIPDYPESYSEQSVLARMIDGLGYRFYWATEALRQEDLDYSPPGEDTRSIFQTMQHIFYLSRTTLLAVQNKPNQRINIDSLGYSELRSRTLNQLIEASNLLKNRDEGLEQSNLIFERGEKTSIYPIWNLINGPISDAIYHTGQIVVFRRSSGNPMDPLVSVFRGKNRTPQKTID